MLGFAMRFSGPAQLGRYSGPSLELSFAGDTYAMGAIGSAPQNKAYSDLITFTRASGGGITNAAGQFEWVGNDVPRITYDPVTLKRLGQLIEEQRTNQMIQSESFGVAPWVPNSMTVGDRSAHLTTIYETADSNFHRIGRTNVSITSGQAVTLSVRAKKLGRRYIYIRESLADGSAIVNTGIDLDARTVTFLPAGRSVVFKDGQNGSLIVSITVTSTDTNTLASVFVGSSDVTVTSSSLPVFVGDVLQGLGLGDIQLEAGSSATSYIPTTSAQVTRAADVATVNALSPWYNALEGTLIFKGFSEQGSGSNTLNVGASLYADGANYMYTPLKNAAGSFRALVARSLGVEVAAIQYPSQGFGGVSSAFSYRENNFSASMNGLAAQSDTSGSVPAISKLNIGSLSGTSNFWNGIISSLTYYPRVIDVQQANA